MAFLHNRISQKELKEQLHREEFRRITVSFYSYFTIPDPHEFRDELYRQLFELAVFGRVYIAREGINAQVSVPESNFEKFQSYIRLTIPAENRECPLRINVAVNDNGKSFWVLKIKVREKIVADGIDDPLFNMGKKGKYLNAAEFNRMTEDPSVVLVDMRNHYEYEVGHFENAIEVPSDTFREQLPMTVAMLRDKKEVPVIMYCTGGIRCEKASAYLLHKGFTNVYHLEGGIIHYANTAREQQLENKFKGKNFVFDDRLGEKISDEVIAVCHQCGKPADIHTNCMNPGCHLLFIQCDDCRVLFEGCCSENCRDITHLPEEEQKIIRKGIDKGRNVFNKSKARQQQLRR